MYKRQCLFRGTDEIVGLALNQAIDTPWGQLCYAGAPHDPPRYGNAGWLRLGCHDTAPWQDGPRLRCLESLYLAQGSPVGHRVRLLLPEGAAQLDDWSATLWSDPNTCTTNDFGDPEICTKIAIHSTAIKGSRARLDDPKKCGRRVYLLSGDSLAQPLSLVVDAHAGRWFLKAGNGYIALYPVGGACIL